jgi:hypothetical protein
MSTSVLSKSKSKSKSGLNGSVVAANVATISAELQTLQRNRAVVLKSRNMQANRLQALVAGECCGYSSSMKEKDRLAAFQKAAKLIKEIDAGGNVQSRINGVVKVTLVGINAFNDMKDSLEKEMVACAKKLPIFDWVQKPEQRGFGPLFLAIVIGETGDLCNYANPAKVWRRLGCAPWAFNGKTLMGATWRSGREGKLPAEEWEAFGYSPRRRSISYLIGEGIVKLNGLVEGSARPCGPYRTRYDCAKALIKSKHPDYSDLRCHRHGMLLATKMLLKNLWWEWNGCPDGGWVG